MDIRHNFILIHLGNSDLGYELVRELYRLKNHLVIVSKCKNHLDELKKQFPKIDRIVCDVKNEENVNELVERCKSVYPFLDIIVHHNFHRNLIAAKNPRAEVMENLRDAEMLSLRLLPIFSKKADGIMIFTNLDDYSFQLKSQKNDTHDAHLFLELKEKTIDHSVKLIQIKVPISYLKIDDSKKRLKVIHHIHNFLSDCEKGKYLSINASDSKFMRWLKKIKPLFFVD